MKTTAAVLLLATVLLGLTHLASANSCGSSNDPSSDFLVFVQYWSPSCCSSLGSSCNASLVENDFTIHGFWPENDDGSWPQYCSPDDFSYNMIRNLTSELDYYWPDLKIGATPSNGLWEHEYERHGSCAVHQSNIMHDEFDFFNHTLTIRKSLPIKQWLAEKNIVPTNSHDYKTQDLIDVIYDHTGQNPLILCSKGNVYEVYLCYSNDLQPMKCPSGVTGCAQSQFCGEYAYFRPPQSN
eukprot:CAMPEP_0177634774 /NCGR_PEP_ID=MMETSP0447-20121125/3545_1 /TAXON_ID=0 /ORGANISM="Stygamoeba regulata, Strain BSH-02190019" /LENGTH=238 /DNA_ID=CAMNT_0019136513 /DNA_START=130 /DNA_END=846 /DNA_ORIENTATION=-